MQLKAFFTALFTFFILSGCSSNSLYHKVLHVPDWIMSPDIEDGLAVSRCVKWSGDYSKNKSVATSLAREAAAEQLVASIKLLNKQWSTEADQKVVVDTVNSGRNIRVDFAELDNEEQLCTLWYVKDESLIQMLKSIASHHQNNIEEPELERQLLQLKSS